MENVENSWSNRLFKLFQYQETSVWLWEESFLSWNYRDFRHFSHRICWWGRVELRFCALSPPLFCVYNPSAGQTMWSGTWILILPLLSFVSIWHGNQYFSQGEWTKSCISRIRLCIVEQQKVKWLSDSCFSLTLFIVLPAEGTNQGLCHY